MKYTVVSIFLICILFIQGIRAQEEPKHEFRSTWIATVSNINWPLNEHRNKPEEQKADLIRMLDLYKILRFNTVLLQVRPECDALYNSSLEPWSRFLTWQQGTDPGYDPLQFAIDEAHKRGIELHVWLNPYRINASTSDGGNYYDSTHIYIEHPEWAIVYSSGKKILNPGKPEVTSYIGSVVRDIILNYNIDGIHFDDYFYSYDGTPSELDGDEYAMYGNGMSLSDWRRDNVNRMVDTVYRIIQEENPDVRFGISPFGIYKDGVPSGISGLNAYSQIYCDPLAWMEDGSVDYITPQMYWPVGGKQDFETLANWWADTCDHFGRHLYAGHGTYRLPDVPGIKKTDVSEELLHETKYYIDAGPVEKDTLNNLSFLEQTILKGTGDPVAPWTLGQIGTQIDIIRENHDNSGLGSVYFSAGDFDRVEGLVDYLTLNKYTHVSLVPEMTWKTSQVPDVVQNIRTVIDGEEYYLAWDSTTNEDDRFVIYASTESLDSSDIVNNVASLMGVAFRNRISFSELNISDQSSIVLTAVSPMGREGTPSSVYTLGNDIPLAELIDPQDNDTLSMTGILSWHPVYSDTLFQVQIAANYSFSNIVFTSVWMLDTMISIGPLQLDGEKDYYWRVRAKREAGGPYTEPAKFRAGFPAIPELTFPANLDQNVSTSPRIRWNASEATDSIRILISESSSFDITIADEIFDALQGEGTLPFELEKNTWYYLKIQSLNDYGYSEFTEFNVFMTSAGELPEVSLISPGDGIKAASFDSLKWETSTTTGTINYLIEIALDSNFNLKIFNTGWINSKRLLISDLNLEGNRTYYWRVKGKSEFGEGEWSTTRKYTAGYPGRPGITAPLNLSVGNDIWTVIEWTSDEETDSVYIEFSEQSDFSMIRHSERFQASGGSGKLTAALDELTWYYVHLQAENEFGGSIISSIKNFQTGESTHINDHQVNNEMMVQVFPNVTREGTIAIRIILPGESEVTIEVLDLLGREIFTVVEDHPVADEQSEFQVETGDFPASGVFFIMVKADNYTRVNRVIVLDM